MKNFIMTIAIIILLVFFTVYQSDINTMGREQTSLKAALDRATSTAALEIDLEQYSDGFIVFEAKDATLKAFEVLQEETGVNDDFTASGDYYTDNMDIYYYYFDDTKIGVKYHNNEPVSSFTFEYGDLASNVTDIKELTGEDFTITRPTVVGVADAGQPEMKLGFLRDKAKIMKVSIYEYDYPR